MELGSPGAKKTTKTARTKKPGCLEVIRKRPVFNAPKVARSVSLFKGLNSGVLEHNVVIWSINASTFPGPKRIAFLNRICARKTAQK